MVSAEFSQWIQWENLCHAVKMKCFTGPFGGPDKKLVYSDLHVALAMSVLHVLISSCVFYLGLYFCFRQKKLIIHVRPTVISALLDKYKWSMTAMHARVSKFQ